MTAKNSGSHLVFQFSSHLVFQLVHQLLMSEAGLSIACTLWPTTNVSFELINLDQDANVRATKADGEQVDFNIRVTLNLALAVRSEQTVEEFMNDLLGGVLPPSTTISAVMFHAADGGSALSVGVFFDGTLTQNMDAFASFGTDFLQGQDLAIATSIELLDSFVLRRAEIQAVLRQALSADFYTPDDPSNFASLSAAPPDRLRLSGRGEFQALIEHAA